MSVVFAACGGSADVTAPEASAFAAEVHQQVPYMRKYQNTDDLTTLVKAVCDGFQNREAYGTVSKTVAAYIDTPASDGAVDGVISAALDTACPELRDAALG